MIFPRDQRRCPFGAYFGGGQVARKNPSDTDIIDDLFVSLSHSRPADRRSILIDLDYEALEFLLEDDLHEDVPWDKPHWVGSFLELVARLDEERFLDFVEKSFSREDAIKRMHIRILGARNASKAFNKLLESGYKRTHVARFFQWAIQDNLLGEFAGSLISSALTLNETSVVAQLERRYASKAYSEIARILQYFKVNKEWLEEVDRLIIEVDRRAPDKFEPIVMLLSNRYWAGTTSRTPGYPGPRDKLIADYFNQRLKDETLRPRVRKYFQERAQAAEASIQRDLEEDERFAGRAL